MINQTYTQMIRCPKCGKLTGTHLHHLHCSGKKKLPGQTGGMSMTSNIDDSDRYGEMDKKYKLCYQYLIYYEKLKDKFRRAYLGDER